MSYPEPKQGSDLPASEPPGSEAIANLTTPVTETRQAIEMMPGVRKAGWVLSGLVVFTFALQLAKEGAGSLAPFVRDTLAVTNPLNAVGFGWLFSYTVMSGSPVAAAALAFLANHTITPIETYAMIAGSRLGASLIVLILGFVYVIRGHGRRSGLSVGLLSLLVTASIYIPALPLGYVILENRWFTGLDLEFRFVDVINDAYGPIVSPLVDRFPGGVIFASGVIALIVAFSFIDRGLPELSLEERGFHKVADLLYRPPVMFMLGFAVTMVSLSVSVSLGILVPLSAKGMVRRENLIPYIMGCNVSTFIDTLVVAVLLGSPEGFTVVLVEMLSVTIISLLVLLVGYDFYERTIVATVDWILDRNRNFAIFLTVFVLAPIILVLI